MENQEIELTRFRQKAHGYRTAIELAPGARILEVLAIACIIEGYRLKKGLLRSEFTVVDLMAGNGFLSEQLYQFGFRNIHALEACNDMSQNTSGQYNTPKHFILHPFADVDSIAPLLGKIRPHVVVSIAGFHHLIEYESDGKTVNVGASVDLQERMTKACMEPLDTDRMLLIVDIYEEELQCSVPESWPYWQRAKAVGQVPNGAVIPHNVKEQLVRAKTFHDFSAIIERHLCNVPIRTGPSLKWFRQVVDSISSAGHKDIALSRRFLDKLSATYKVTFGTTPCPWLFANIAILQKFLVTFWFEDASQDRAKIEKIMDAAERVNGLHANGTFASFGWNLGYAIVEARSGSDGAVARAARRRMTIFFWVLLALCAINVCLKLLSYWSGLYGFLDNVISAVLGILGSEGVDEWKQRSERQESHRVR